VVLEFCLITGVDLSKNIAGKPKILGTNVVSNWWIHGRFSIIGGTCPGCPQVYAYMCLLS